MKSSSRPQYSNSGWAMGGSSITVSIGREVLGIIGRAANDEEQRYFMLGIARDQCGRRKLKSSTRNQ